MTIPIFTFHYVYIYIQCTEIRSCVTLLFTFHYVYIYIFLCRQIFIKSHHLHSTMFIFI